MVKDLGITFDRTSLYSDSMVVLGYLRNTAKCFAKYFTHRVEAFLKSYPEKHWQYVGTCENPADLCTRPISPTALKESFWFTGPPFLMAGREPVELQATPELPEEVPLVSAHSAQVYAPAVLWRQAAEAQSSWVLLVRLARRTLSCLLPALDRAR